ncbi:MULTISPECIES: IDEAL domain-containing protein [unclassified Bacillus (in: firmicutes)]|uniref:IDEAL domain-containing protein n=1 Tax=unclassified Bacillus (in: firmicutes) TaxID=185979 RepID=UPI000BEF1E09|nr:MULTISPECIES: IDEAL domain-containing protein [unclassified Bacillus (in: firmicutes)]PEJ59058.1 group-specific protein [Bacillus sp. AFS002410]PEK99043.1 group-specific protein [Bacillus sp. AFS017336]
MNLNNDTILKTGDWVKGISMGGELVLGFIESFTIQDEIVKVNVITSDNEKTVGKTINMLNKNVKKLPDSKVTNKEQISFLIDLALSTGDEDWFEELSSQLNSMRQLVSGLK